MSASDPSKLIKVGAVGTILVALCCFTPILLILLGVVGLSALTGYLDVVLFPALAAFIALTIYAIVRERKAEACRAPGAAGDKS
jgi:hypothetical protein